MSAYGFLGQTTVLSALGCVCAAIVIAWRRCLRGVLERVLLRQRGADRNRPESTPKAITNKEEIIGVPFYKWEQLGIELLEQGEWQFWGAFPCARFLSPAFLEDAIVSDFERFRDDYYHYKYIYYGRARGFYHFGIEKNRKRVRRVTITATFIHAKRPFEHWHKEFYCPCPGLGQLQNAASDYKPNRVCIHCAYILTTMMLGKHERLVMDQAVQLIENYEATRLEPEDICRENRSRPGRAYANVLRAIAQGPAGGNRAGRPAHAG